MCPGSSGWQGLSCEPGPWEENTLWLHEPLLAEGNTPTVVLQMAGHAFRVMLLGDGHDTGSHVNHACRASHVTAQGPPAGQERRSGSWGKSSIPAVQVKGWGLPDPKGMGGAGVGRVFQLGCCRVRRGCLKPALPPNGQPEEHRARQVSTSGVTASGQCFTRQTQWWCGSRLENTWGAIMGSLHCSVSTRFAYVHPAWGDRKVVGSAMGWGLQSEGEAISASSQPICILICSMKRQLGGTTAWSSGYRTWSRGTARPAPCSTSRPRCSTTCRHRSTTSPC